jgi:hypothetical protein
MKLTFLLKQDRPETGLSSYRHISLLRKINKVFEKVIGKAVMRHCSKIEILQDQQFRFRSDHNILHAMSKVISSTIDICR